MLRKTAFLLCSILLFAGCVPISESEPSAQPLATPGAVPGETPAQGGPETILASCIWQDVYDDSFWLEFDLLQGTMTENNRVLKSKSTYRITIDTENSLFLADTGSEEKEIPFRLEDGFLTVDYGDPIGEILYQAADKTP